MLVPGRKAPDLDLPLTIDARFELSKQAPDQFTMLVFYRGKHCPICKSYLEELGTKLRDFVDAGISPFAVSMDDEERAMVVDREWETHDLPLAHSMDEETARAWGLYISSRRDGSEEPETFSEPGLFLVRPDGTLYLAQVQSAPFGRPDPGALLDQLKFAIDEDYPPRGAAT